MMLPYDAEGGIPKVVANKMAVLASGAWVLPFWREPGKTCPRLRSEAGEMFHEEMFHKASPSNE